MPDYSYQEIRVRPYVEAVLGQWYWILGLGLFAGVLAFGGSLLLLSPTYEATALVTFTETQQRVDFDSRIVTVAEDRALKIYSEIALSDEFLEALKDRSPEVTRFSSQQLRSTLEASVGNDPSVLRLTVRSSDPASASDVANAWAEQLVLWATETAGESSAEQLRLFERSLEEATSELEAAEKDNVEFQGQNQSVILENELLSLQEAHAALLAKKEEIERLLRDIDSLLAITQTDIADDGLAAADQFIALVLSLRAFDGSASADNADFAWQLQVNSSDAMAETGGSLEEQVLNLRPVLEVQAEQTIAAIAEIEPQILAVQRERQEAKVAESLLTRNLELATVTHTALARRVEEKRVEAQENFSGVSLASRSSPPSAPIGPRKSLITFAAIAGVVLLSILVIILTTWWREEQ